MSTPRASLWRMFCAVELPAEVKARVADYVARLRAAAPGASASWVRPDTLHITVKFIGEVEEERAHALTLAAARAAGESEPFDLSIAGTGAFPARGPARVLWLGLADETGGLAHLQARLEEACAAARFARETRPFKPHLTLARLRTPADADRLARLHRATAFEPVSFHVSTLHVIRSELAPTGSRYTNISRHGLTNG